MSRANASSRIRRFARVPAFVSIFASARVPAFVALFATALVAFGCASSQAPAWLPARLSVEVLRGFPAGGLSAQARSGPVVVLFDSTASMAAPTALGASHQLAAQRAASRFVESLPERSDLWLFAMGGHGSSGCQPAVRAGRATGSAGRRPLLSELERLRSQGESSLASSLDAVRRSLVEDSAAPGARVVVFSDLGRQCGGDLCAAARSLAEQGARLDIVALGDARVPACLSEPDELVTLPPPSAASLEPVHFRLEVDSPEPLVVGCSDVGGLPLAAPAGRGTVVVELDPPLRVQGYFGAGRSYVLQVLEFPAHDPPLRQWRWRERVVDPELAR